MHEDRENRYKVSRKTAGLTQEQASELLHVSLRSLSDYENGRSPVPDDIVDRMVRAYNAPMLAWWHLKEYTILGKHLPDIVSPQTPGDMGFQAILANDECASIVSLIKLSLHDGMLSDEEIDELSKSLPRMKSAAGKLLSACAYLEGLIKQREAQRYGI